MLVHTCFAVRVQYYSGGVHARQIGGGWGATLLPVPRAMQYTIDFQMADLPTSTDVDAFWASVHNIRTVDTDQPVYGTLLVLIRALLALPASNADSERSFSMVRKIDSEDRSHLERTTVASLLVLKLNIDEECFSYKPPKALLELNKSAVRRYNEEHGSYN